MTKGGGNTRLRMTEGLSAAGLARRTVPPVRRIILVLMPAVPVPSVSVSKKVERDEGDEDE
jgi:hypothetical protein